MEIVAIPLLQDNYAWLLGDPKSRACAVVDPSTPGPVMQAIAERGWQLRWILVTHHHHDHTGGIAGLLHHHPALEVWCSDHDLERVTGATHGLRDNAEHVVCGQPVRVLAVPGHTLGALAYYFPRQHALLTGDTLFTAGCGRLFEGTAAQMYGSLQRLLVLPDDTQIYCGHEYTEKNLCFAAQVAPGIPVDERLAQTRELRRRGLPTVPASLATERATNPFLRAPDLDTFTRLRQQRDEF